jgi:hypothetical protein
MASSSSIQRFVRVGVGCLIESVDYPGFCILGRRLGSHGAGQLALPGGHLEVRDVAGNFVFSLETFFIFLLNDNNARTFLPPSLSFLLLCNLQLVVIRCRSVSHLNNAR